MLDYYHYRISTSLIEGMMDNRQPFTFTLNYATREPGFRYRDEIQSASKESFEERLQQLEDFYDLYNSPGSSSSSVDKTSILESILEVVPYNLNNKEALQRLERLIRNKIAEDTDTPIRCELLEATPTLCMNLQEKAIGIVENTLLPHLAYTISDTRAPKVSKEVRKDARGALTLLHEQNFLSTHQLEDIILPILIKALDEYPVPFSPNAEDARLDLFGIIFKFIRPPEDKNMPYLLERTWVINNLLPLYTKLCTDPSFHVRKMCAFELGHLAVFFEKTGDTEGRDWVTEKVLVPYLIQLSNDDVWGVRKDVVKSFPLVSQSVTRRCRCVTLAPHFDRLFTDISRWVIAEAYLILGVFIGTYFESGVDHGVRVRKDPLREMVNLPSESVYIEEPDDDAILKFLAKEEEASRRILEGVLPKNIIIPAIPQLRTHTATIESETDHMPSGLNPLFDSDDESNASERKKSIDENQRKPCISTKMNDVNSIGSYWPTTLHCEVGDEFPTNVQAKELQSPLEDLDVVDYLNRRMSKVSLVADDLSHKKAKSRTASLEVDYEVVPACLIRRFNDMVNPTLKTNVEAEITKHCAMALPCVVITLGREMWPAISETFRLLATDRQWKVRLSIANSIHHVATAIGPEQTVRDLLPTYKCLMQDLDEVRMGVLEHLCDFFRQLPMAERLAMLEELNCFMMPQEKKDYRFRLLLIQQIGKMCQLYSVKEVDTFFAGIAMTLTIDSYAIVREEAADLIVTILGVFCDNEQRNDEQAKRRCDSLCYDLAKSFASSAHWRRRQVFCYVCRQIGKRLGIMPIERFERDFMQLLLQLAAEDSVDCVRATALNAIDALIHGKPDVGDDVDDEDVIAPLSNHEAILATLKRISEVDDNRTCRLKAYLLLDHPQLDELMAHFDYKTRAANPYKGATAPPPADEPATQVQNEDDGDDLMEGPPVQTFDVVTKMFVHDTPTQTVNLNATLNDDDLNDEDLTFDYIREDVEQQKHNPRTFGQYKPDHNKKPGFEQTSDGVESTEKQSTLDNNANKEKSSIEPSSLINGQHENRAVEKPLVECLTPVKGVKTSDAVSTNKKKKHKKKN